MKACPYVCDVNDVLHKHKDKPSQPNCYVCNRCLISLSLEIKIFGNPE